MSGEQAPARFQHRASTTTARAASATTQASNDHGTGGKLPGLDDHGMGDKLPGLDDQGTGYKLPGLDDHGMGGIRDHPGLE